ncbi:cytochrome P450 [Pleurocapsa sp. CCALA 161]|uniref:cytochrome P450 n=1 Tax=Pleurocapsa sp. CCALA 161 TaxID=2107688 RepID=UPI000D083EF0|nr:cytochrome P450 [Pleurocapsa sp. CCALA 161]PSB07194.1 cytochrome P450 [Pleurocapsa sp. CCALA 161]
MKLIPRLKQSSLQQRLQWIAQPAKYMDSAGKQAPDIFQADITGGDGYVFVNHPEAMRQIVTSDRSKYFASSKENRLLQPLVGDNSLLMIEGDRHRQRRKLLLPPFHGERMQAYGALICNLTRDLVNQLQPNQSFVARHITQEISLQVILEAVYGLQDSDRSEELKQRIARLANIFESTLTSALLFFPWLHKDLGAWSPWGNLMRQQKAIDEAIYQEIANRRTEDCSQRQDILSLMMSARDESGEAMKDYELRDELMTLMLAGHETTATAIAWGLYWLHRYPEIKAKLQAEIASLGANPDPMAIAKLPYLTAVCKETLRIYPVAMLTFPRTVLESTELMGYKLEVGQVLMGCIYLMHQREDVYPEHHQFKPERFLEREFDSYEFFPFGGGKRRCIGEALAMLELKLVLATIISEYNLELKSGAFLKGNRPEIPARRGVTLAPKKGVAMVFQGKR